MMTIDLDTDQERRLRQLAESLGQDPSVLAGHIVEAYLELHAGMDDSARRWAEASVALAPEIFEAESWDEGEMDGPGRGLVGGPPPAGRSSPRTHLDPFRRSPGA